MTSCQIKNGTPRTEKVYYFLKTIITTLYLCTALFRAFLNMNVYFQCEKIQDLLLAYNPAHPSSSAKLNSEVNSAFDGSEKLFTKINSRTFSSTESAHCVIDTSTYPHITPPQTELNP